jgi:hypothetical protein
MGLDEALIVLYLRVDDAYRVVTFPSVPMMMRHRPPGCLSLRA